MTARPAHRPVLETTRQLQIVLGAAWLVDGLLQLQPKMFGPGFVSGVLAPAGSGQPGPIAWFLSHADHLISVRPAGFNAVFASVQILIGLGLLHKDTVKPALITSMVWSLGVWSMGEGFGMLLTGQASPLTGAPGAVLLYGLLGVLAWPRQDRGIAAGRLPRRPARILWALFWVGMAGLWLAPANRQAGSVSSALTSAASGEPGWFSHLQLVLAQVTSGDGTLLAIVLAAASVVIGIGPLVSRRPNRYLLAGTVLSLVFWVTGEALGGMLTGLGTDPNAAPLVTLLGLAAFPVSLSLPTLPRPVPTGLPA